MTGRAGTHLLASRRGYRTIAASPDVSAAERIALEALVFGQSSDPGFLSSLDREPAVVLRIMPADPARPGAAPRVALTRCFAGHPDEAGRATLELRSLLLEPGDYERLVRGDFASFLADERLWSRGTSESGRDATLPASPGPVGAPPTRVGRRDLLMMDAWVRVLDHPGSTGVLADGAEARRTLLDFLKVLGSDDLRRCRWGLRLLSLAVDAHLATAPPSLDRGRRTLLPIDLRAPAGNESIRFLLESGGAIERLPSSEILRRGGAIEASGATPWGGLADFSHDGSDAMPAAGRSHAPSPPVAGMVASRRRLAIISLLGALLLIAALVALVVTMRLRGGAAGATDAETRTADSGGPLAPRAETSRDETPAIDHPAPPPGSSAPPSVSSAPPPGSSAPPSVSSAPANDAPTGESVAPVPEAPAPPAPPPSSDSPPLPPPTVPAAPESRERPDEASTSLTERMRAALQSARSDMESLGVRTGELQQALAGPAPNRTWSDRFDRWSPEHCERVIRALSDLDRSLRLQPVFWDAAPLREIADSGTRGRPWTRCDAFVQALPSAIGGLECLRLLAEEPFRNAMATRTSAIEQLQRSGCDPVRVRELARSTQELRATLRPFIGAGTKPDPAAIAGMAARLRASLRSGLDLCRDSLAPDSITLIEQAIAPR